MATLSAQHSSPALPSKDSQSQSETDNSTTMTNSDLAKATRKSIKKNFPMGSVMSKGQDNPITLHSVDDQLFARIWSVIAETMCVTVELSRTTKEAIATKVSESNACPVCIAAHTMISVVSIELDSKQVKTQEEDEKKNKQHEQALQYADMLLDEMNRELRDNCSDATSISSGSSIGSGGSGSKNSKKARRGRKYSHLNSTAKAEVALVVLLFDHINRVVSVIMGEEMSTAMFSVPRSMAKSMEKPSAMRAMGKMMYPLLSGAFKMKHSPGMTLPLFPEEEQASLKNRKPLPAHLQGILLAGLERANAVGRVIDWVETFEKEKLVGPNVMSEDLIAFVMQQSEKAHPAFNSPGKVAKWVERCVEEDADVELDDLEQESGKAITIVLLLATFAPQTAYKCNHWNTVVKHVGPEMARCIVAWWSLRCTLRDAKGLDAKIDAQTMVRLLNEGLSTQ